MSLGPYTLTPEEAERLRPLADRYTAVRLAMGDTESTEREALQNAAMLIGDRDLLHRLRYGIEYDR